MSRDENNFVLDLLDSGVSVIKVYDDNVDVFPEYVKINTVPFVQPDNVRKLRVPSPRVLRINGKRSDFLSLDEVHSR